MPEAQARVVAHADWSVRPEKRWCTVARLGRRAAEVFEPFQVDDPPGLPARVRQVAGVDSASPALIGVDFPLGLPVLLARQLGLSGFREFLDRWADGEWPLFEEPASTPAEISPQRPFYPRRPGGTKQRHLLDALGAGSMDTLRRRCDLRTPHRPAAAPLLWILGAQQVGRAALNGWRELLLPLRDELRLWPFDGALPDLVGQGTTIAEAYPAEFHHHLGIRLEGSKRDAAVRRATGSALLRWARDHRAWLADALTESVEAGFGEQPDGEDPFDSFIGLLGTLQVAAGLRHEGAPRCDPALAVEGWILGQEP